MTLKDMIGLSFVGCITLAVLAIAAVFIVAIYLDCIRPHLVETENKVRRQIGRIISFRLTIEREPIESKYYQPK